MSMSQPAICSAVARCPIPYLTGASFLLCANTGTTSTSDAATVRTCLPDLDILDLSVRVERPGLDPVVVVDRIDPADFAQSIFARLHVAGVIHRPRLQQQRLAVPVEFIVEAHAGSIEYRTIETRCAPIASAVERDIDALGLAAS